jgi:hypothetical protein
MNDRNVGVGTFLVQNILTGIEYFLIESVKKVMINFRTYC